MEITQTLVDNCSQLEGSFSNIILSGKLGSGTYATVYKAIWGKRCVAVKRFGMSVEQKLINTEVKQLTRVRHANIISFYGIDLLSRYLIMEYADGGSLHDFLHCSMQPKYTLSHALNWALQCAEGVAYLHGMVPRPLIHRDLKPLNLLLACNGQVLKICDFGTVVDKSSMMTNNRGSAAWMAPEVFEGSKYTEKCDVFSWGIILWELLSRQQPFKEVENAYSIMWKIHKGERPPLLNCCPVSIEKLMTSCWKAKPEQRPSMSYVVSCMNELIVHYPGADRPLNYLFACGRVIAKDNNRWNDTHINEQQLSLAFLNNAFQSEKDLEVLTDYENLFPDRGTNNSNIMPIRYEAIRKKMDQTAKNPPMQPLVLSCDNIESENFSASFANQSGSSSNFNASNHNKTLMQNVDPETLESCSKGTEMKYENACFAEIFDNELQTAELLNTKKSADIYREHRTIAQDILRVDTLLCYRQARKNEITKVLTAYQRDQRNQLMKNVKQKKELLNLCNAFKFQLTQLLSEVKPVTT